MNDVPEKSNGQAYKLRRQICAILSVVTFAIMGLVLPVAPAVAAPSGWDYVSSDTWGFWDQTGSRVYTAGTVDWYEGGFLKTSVLGAIRNDNTGYVYLNREGCLWVKVTWIAVTGTASWPPSGGANSVSDGYYRACGKKGMSIALGGINHNAKALSKMNICIGYSTNQTYELRRHTSCHSQWSLA